MENKLKCIKEKIRNIDPIGIIEGGAPDDEYDAYTQLICSISTEGVSPIELESRLTQIFEDSFGKKSVLPDRIKSLIREIKSCD